MSRMPPDKLKLKAEVPVPLAPVRVILPPNVKVPPLRFTLAVATVLFAADAPEIEATVTAPSATFK